MDSPYHRDENMAPTTPSRSVNKSPVPSLNLLSLEKAPISDNDTCREFETCREYDALQGLPSVTPRSILRSSSSQLQKLELASEPRRPATQGGRRSVSFARMKDVREFTVRNGSECSLESPQLAVKMALTPVSEGTGSWASVAGEEGHLATGGGASVGTGPKEFDDILDVFRDAAGTSGRRTRQATPRPKSLGGSGLYAMYGASPSTLSDIDSDAGTTLVHNYPSLDQIVCGGSGVPFSNIDVDASTGAAGRIDPSGTSAGSDSGNPPSRRGSLTPGEPGAYVHTIAKEMRAALNAHTARESNDVDGSPPENVSAMSPLATRGGYRQLPALARTLTPRRDITPGGTGNNDVYSGHEMFHAEGTPVGQRMMEESAGSTPHGSSPPTNEVVSLSYYNPYQQSPSSSTKGSDGPPAVSDMVMSLPRPLHTTSVDPVAGGTGRESLEGYLEDPMDTTRSEGLLVSSRGIVDTTAKCTESQKPSNVPPLDLTVLSQRPTVTPMRKPATGDGVSFNVRPATPHLPVEVLPASAGVAVSSPESLGRTCQSIDCSPLDAISSQGGVHQPKEMPAQRKSISLCKEGVVERLGNGQSRLTPRPSYFEVDTVSFSRLNTPSREDHPDGELDFQFTDEIDPSVGLQKSPMLNPDDSAWNKPQRLFGTPAAGNQTPYAPVIEPPVTFGKRRPSEIMEGLRTPGSSGYMDRLPSEESPDNTTLLPPLSAEKGLRSRASMAAATMGFRGIEEFEDPRCSRTKRRSNDLDSAGPKRINTQETPPSLRDLDGGSEMFPNLQDVAGGEQNKTPTRAQLVAKPMTSSTDGYDSSKGSRVSTRSRSPLLRRGSHRRSEASSSNRVANPPRTDAHGNSPKYASHELGAPNLDERATREKQERKPGDSNEQSNHERDTGNEVLREEARRKENDEVQRRLQEEEALRLAEMERAENEEIARQEEELARKQQQAEEALRLADEWLRKEKEEERRKWEQRRIEEEELKRQAHLENERKETEVRRIAEEIFREKKEREMKLREEEENRRKEEEERRAEEEEKRKAEKMRSLKLEEERREALRVAEELQALENQKKEDILSQYLAVTPRTRGPLDGHEETAEAADAGEDSYVDYETDIDMTETQDIITVRGNRKSVQQPEISTTVDMPKTPVELLHENSMNNQPKASNYSFDSLLKKFGFGQEASAQEHEDHGVTVDEELIDAEPTSVVGERDDTSHEDQPDSTLHEVSDRTDEYTVTQPVYFNGGIDWERFQQEVGHRFANPYQEELFGKDLIRSRKSVFEHQMQTGNEGQFDDSWVEELEIAPPAKQVISIDPRDTDDLLVYITDRSQVQAWEEISTEIEAECHKMRTFDVEAIGDFQELPIAKELAGVLNKINLAYEVQTNPRKRKHVSSDDLRDILHEGHEAQLAMQKFRMAMRRRLRTAHNLALAHWKIYSKKMKRRSLTLMVQQAKKIHAEVLTKREKILEAKGLLEENEKRIEKLQRRRAAQNMDGCSLDDALEFYQKNIAKLHKRLETLQVEVSEQREQLRRTKDYLINKREELATEHEQSCNFLNFERDMWTLRSDIEMMERYAGVQVTAVTSDCIEFDVLTSEACLMVSPDIALPYTKWNIAQEGDFAEKFKLPAFDREKHQLRDTSRSAMQELEEEIRCATDITNARYEYFRAHTKEVRESLEEQNYLIEDMVWKHSALAERNILFPESVRIHQPCRVTLSWRYWDPETSRIYEGLRMSVDHNLDHLQDDYRGLGQEYIYTDVSIRKALMEHVEQGLNSNLVPVMEEHHLPIISPFDDVDDSALTVSISVAPRVPTSVIFGAAQSAHLLITKAECVSLELRGFLSTFHHGVGEFAPKVKYHAKLSATDAEHKQFGKELNARLSFKINLGEFPPIASEKKPETPIHGKGTVLVNPVETMFWECTIRFDVDVDKAVNCASLALACVTKTATVTFGPIQEWMTPDDMARRIERSKKMTQALRNAFQKIRIPSTCNAKSMSNWDFTSDDAPVLPGRRMMARVHDLTAILLRFVDENLQTSIAS